MKTALIIPCFNRPDYMRRCFASLMRSDLSAIDLLIMIDDRSTDSDAIRLFDEFDMPGVKIEKLRYGQNVGIKEVMKYGYYLAFTDCDVAINLDSDSVVHPDWVKRLLFLYSRNPEKLISGFGSGNKTVGVMRNPIVSDHSCLGYQNRKYCNGINMVMGRGLYNRLVYQLDREGNWDFNLSRRAGETLITVPSVVQHIGLKSSMGHMGSPDVADDFQSIELPSVTLFGIDAHDPDGIMRAAEICQEHIRFGAVKIITERLFTGREAYSKFCIRDMADHISTEHVLIIHPDGYIQNPFAWREEWLEYDYIGATWWYKDNMNVGNGGFSLRSRRLLKMLAQMEISDCHPEDDVICRRLRTELERQGIRFAPEAVANQFSIEAYGSPDNKYCGQFGFHGYHVAGLPVQPLPRIRPIKVAPAPKAKPVLNNARYGRR